MIMFSFYTVQISIRPSPHILQASGNENLHKTANRCQFLTDDDHGQNPCQTADFYGQPAGDVKWTLSVTQT